MKYTLKTNEFNSQYISQNTNLEKLLKDLKRHIANKIGNKKIIVQFVLNCKIIDNIILSLFIKNKTQ